MLGSLRWIWLLVDCGILFFLLTAAIHYQTSVYLMRQAKGQLSLLWNTTSILQFEKQTELTAAQKENLALVTKVREYSVDSLGFKPTGNFTTIYDQKGAALLWVITACQPYDFTLYTWNFPIVGEVTYKGFFSRKEAEKEYDHLVCEGYDVDLREVSAWSTLGWFNDPLLSSTIDRSKGSLCNLLFHELFHTTYYAKGSVTLNENLANFVAHKATLKFLRSDTSALNAYLDRHNDNWVFTRYMLRQIDRLKNYYEHIREYPDRYPLKLKAIFQIADSVDGLPIRDKKKYASRKKNIMKFKNASFVDFLQYDSMQDSLEEVFNKIYKGKIENLVRDLKPD
jgi:predicted aminopeptidase